MEARSQLRHRPTCCRDRTLLLSPLRRYSSIGVNPGAPSCLLAARPNAKLARNKDCNSFRDAVKTGSRYFCASKAFVGTVTDPIRPEFSSRTTIRSEPEAGPLPTS